MNAWRLVSEQLIAPCLNDLHLGSRHVYAISVIYHE